MMRSWFRRTGSFHLDQPLAAVGLGLGDELLGSRELVAVLRQEFGGGEEVAWTP